MKIAVLIMSTPVEPSTRNMKGMMSTFINDADTLAKEGKLKHTYDFIMYEGVVKDTPMVSAVGVPRLLSETVELDSNVRVLKRVYDAHESVYTTYEKTYAAFMGISGQYDYIVRINISTFINMKSLDAVIEGLDSQTVYCNAINTHTSYGSPYINDVYPRGDFYIMSDAVMEGVIEYGKDLIDSDKAAKNRIDLPHVDDCLVGVAMLRYFNDIDKEHAYSDHMKMLEYNFLPQYSLDAIEKVNVRCIASRVKTMPPDTTYSGYSWDDNDYRKLDSEKMGLMSFMMKRTPDDVYNSLTINKLFTEKGNGRPSVFIYAVSCNPDSDEYAANLFKKWHKD